MRILLDQGVPAPLAQAFGQHEVKTAFQMGWSNLENGTLLQEAEHHFDALVTTDKNMEFQQNLGERRLAILVLPTPRWPVLRPVAHLIAEAVLNLEPTDYVRWNLPDDVTGE